MGIPDQNIVREISGQCLCLNLRKTSRNITRFYDQILDEAGIRSTQLSILAAVGSTESEGIGLTDLSSFLAMDRTTLTRTMKPLETRGLVKLNKTEDGRKKAYTLTGRGWLMLDRAYPLWKQAQNEVLGTLGGNRRISLNRQLLRVMALGRKALQKMNGH